MPDLLVTGTDTGIGKTLIAAAIIKALRAREVRAIGFKPVETGCDGQQDTDSEVLARASGESIPLAKPLVQLGEPLAPAVAADRAHVRIDPHEIESRVEQLRAAGFALVVEGAGGVMVPLVWREASAAYTVLDLAEHMKLEAVVVGRAGLGTLNHIAMTVAMLASRSVRVRGIVLNGGTRSGDLAEATNPSVLSRMLPGLPIIEVPRHQGTDAVSATAPLVSSLV